MREIKFRGWDKKNKLMTKALVINFGFNGGIVNILSNTVRNGEAVIPGNDCILMQYTGLTDNNGKEIFEGDICKITATQYTSNETISLEEGDTFTASVRYDSYRFTISTKESEMCLAQVEYEEMEIEIIGNIYENPELLKDGKNGN
jgi:uncharacterized phage protein (TIGR01671 family)